MFIIKQVILFQHFIRCAGGCLPIGWEKRKLGLRYSVRYVIFHSVF